MNTDIQALFRDRERVPNTARPLFDAGAGGIRSADYLQWHRLVSQDGEGGGEDYPAGIEYDATDNLVRITGVIVGDMTAHFFNYRGVASPGMLRREVGKAQDGWALEINSPGGNVFSAAEMVAYLRKRKPQMSVVSGIAASAAAILMLTASSRWAGSDLALLMYHAPWGIFLGNAAELQRQTDTLRKIESGFVDFIGSAAPQAATDRIEKTFATGDDLFLTAADAVEIGILTGILQAEDGEGEGDDGGDGKSAADDAEGNAGKSNGKAKPAADIPPAPAQPGSPPPADADPRGEDKHRLTEMAALNARVQRNHNRMRQSSWNL